MKWNTVTWYSKTLALILFVALPFAGFYVGLQYGQGFPVAQAPTTSTSTGSGSGDNGGASTVSGVPEYYTNVAEWQVNRHDDAGFVMAYPLDFPVDDNHATTPTSDWRVNSPNINGVKVLTLTIPKIFEPQTNLVDANLTVGYSANTLALNQCLKPDTAGGPIVATSTATINGINFTVFKTSDAGAGNLYETTSYRTLHNGKCYAVEYTIHSSQIANYPAEYHLQQFDGAKLTSVLDRIIGTFYFL